jgi:alanine dehydrogenase
MSGEGRRAKGEAGRAGEVIILTQRDVAGLADVRLAIRVTREAFKAMARGETVMPPKVYLPLPGGSDFRAMPAYLRRPPACGIKWVNVHPRNRARRLPTVMAVIVLNDPATGVPLAVMDGLLITKLRTAAAAAVAAKALARPESRTVGLVGCGAQAPAQIAALAAEFRIRRVRAWGALAGEARRFCARMARRHPGISFEPAPTIERCARQADILVTLTPSRRPLVRRAWLAPGTHVNAVGADAPGKQELDPRILTDALVVVDEREQALHGGELNVPVARKQFHPRDIHASLGEVLTGRRRGRRSRTELTVFDSTGLAIHDVALGAAVTALARRKRIGRQIKLFGVIKGEIRGDKG